MTSFDRYSAVLKELHELGILIEPKESKWYWRALNTLLHVISFGKVKFNETFTSTIGTRIGTPVGWDNFSFGMKHRILSHELVHFKQFKKYGLGSIWFGIIVVGIAYILLPLPIGLAWCRMRLEREAYEQSIRGMIQDHGPAAALETKEHIVKQFVTIAYFWMWPFRSSVERWFMEALHRIALEEGYKLSETGEWTRV